MRDGDATDTAIRQIVAAINNPGPIPSMHRRVMARHRKEFPTLWSAIDALLAANPHLTGVRRSTHD
jgi:hypothetical protein